MRILIAPDKFKGSVSAGEVAAGLAEILASEGHNTVCLPIADGGEGTARVLCEALEGNMETVTVQDPLGRMVRAEFAIVGSLAILEMSQASGLWRLQPDELDPWRASTFGTGELIRVSVERFGVKKIVIGIGGSATNDGGTGLAKALGIQFRGTDEIPADLQTATGVDFEKLIDLPEIEIACDVENPLLGENGATRIYGPQKGISPADFEKHEARFSYLVELLGEQGSKLANLPGAGAAGGLGFGLVAFCGAKLKPGFDLVAGLLGLPEAIQNCDFVITGEGNLDRQTLNGKGPHGVAQLAREAGKPVLAVVGGTDQSAEIEAAFDAILPMKPAGMTLQESISAGAELLNKKEFRTELIRQINESGS